MRPHMCSDDCTDLEFHEDEAYRSARERFVEAMRQLVAVARLEVLVDDARQAIDAFADAVCESGGDLATCRLATDGTPEEHAACRASLRKDCGLVKCDE